MLTLRMPLALAVALTGVSLGSVSASAESLAGSWNGGGSVSFGSGKHERARCRASYTPASKTSYHLVARCATPSGNVTQSATVRGSGNSYRGGFYNAEWDARGSISVTVRGSSQTVRISSSKGSALLRLSR